MNINSLLLRKGLLLLIAIPLLFTSFTLKGAYLEKVPTIVSNPDGTKIECYASGDEFFNYLHDENGYTIIQGNDGYYYYGVVKSDLIIASDYRVNSVLPKSTGLIPNALISEKEYKRRVNTYWTEVKDDGAKAPHAGSMNNLVIYIRFNDDAEFTAQRSVFDGRLNSTTGASLKDYFQEVSYGQLDITSHHFPVAELTTNLSYQDTEDRNFFQPYNETSNPNGYNDETQRRVREHDLLQRAVNAVESEIPQSLVIDADNDGYVDNVCFIIKGASEGWNDLLWAHRWVLYSYTVEIHDKRVWDYTFQPEDQADTYVISHEMFHTLGAPDLYRYSHDGFTPVGLWDLMGSGYVHMGAYMKYKYAEGNWVSEIPIISEPGEYTLSPLTSSTNNAYRINSPFSTTEYFVVEYRKKGGLYESTLPQSGLLVYRINTLADNGNADGPPDEVYLYRPNGTSTANGQINLAALSSDYGNSAIADGLNLAPFLSNGSMGGLNIQDIGSPGETITFTLSEASVYDVNLSSNPSNKGFAWDVTNSRPYSENMNVTVKAEPIFGYQLENWTNASGDILSTEQTYTFAMPANEVNLVANFTEKESYNVNFEVKNQFDVFVEDATIAIQPFTGKVTDYGQFISSKSTSKLPFNIITGNISGITPTAVESSRVSNFIPTAYSKEATGEWIHWDTGTNNSGIGTGDIITFMVSSRWKATDLVAYNGQLLSKIAFFPKEANAEYTLKIWLGDDAIEIYSQSVQAPTINEWNTVLLDIPFQINASYDLWFGYEVNTQSGHPAGCDSGPAVSGKGNMIYWNNSWVLLSDLNESLNYNWNIQAFVGNSILKATNAEGLTNLKLEPGVYDYSVSKHNYEPFEDSFTVVDADVNLYPVITRGATYSVTFEVVDDSELPLENALVNFNGADYVTDIDGNVKIDDLDPWEYEYTVKKEGYIQTNGVVEVIDKDVVKSISLSSVPTYTVTFTVVSSQGAVEGANINFVDNDYSTNSEGIAIADGIYSGTYSYTITKDSYHSMTGSLEVTDADVELTISFTPVSVSGLDSEKFNLYPNPFTNSVTIKGLQDVERIVISNIIGQKILDIASSKRESIELNTSKFDKGVHLLTLYFKDGSRITKKIIKN